MAIGSHGLVIGLHCRHRSAIRCDHAFRGTAVHSVNALGLLCLCIANFSDLRLNGSYLVFDILTRRATGEHKPAGNQQNND
jgi:hypothetical protein